MKRSMLVFLSLVVIVLTSHSVIIGQGPPVHSHASYIIVFNPGVEPRAAEQALVRMYGIHSTHVYQSAIRGMAGAVPLGRLNALRNDPRVAYVEANQQVFLFQDAIPTGIDRMDAEPDAARKPGFNVSNPVNIDVAIIDTGLDIDHPDLNVVGGRRFYTDVICILGICLPVGSGQDNNYDDDNGHGTHVGGTVAALDNGIGAIGVAPGARLWAIKVIGANGSGYVSDMIAGIDWITARATTIKVANMSLGFEGSSAALDTAINNSVAAGIFYAVAAGNNNKNASTFSPANNPNVTTVSAFSDFDGIPGGLGSPTCRQDEDDTRANFSNYGSTVEIAAPGVCILSTWPGGGYNTISGTSMASPHAAGAAALYRAANPGSTPLQVQNALIAAGDPAPCAIATGICADDPDGIQEPLLDVGEEGTLPPVNNPPIANAGGPYSGLEDSAITFDGSTSFDPDGDPLTYSWDFGDGNSGSGVNASHTYLWGGNFTVMLTVNDGKGAVNSSSVSILVNEVNDVPIANPGGPYSGTVGQALTLSAAGSSDYDNADGTAVNDQILTYSWDFGDGNSGSGVSVNHAYNTSGNYTVTLTVGDGIASHAVSTVAIISDEPPLNKSPVANPGGPYSGLVGQALNFDGSASSDPDGDPLTYNWDFGDGSSGSGVSVSHTYAATGNYTITLMVSDGTASHSASTTAAISEPPSAGLSITQVWPNPLLTSVSPAGTFIYGTGFVPGAVVTLENGQGPEPTVLDAGVIDSSTIALLLTLKNAGPQTQVWDVRVTNPDGASAVLPGGLTILRQ